MLAKLRPRSVYDIMAAIACVGVLAGGTAYAANTIGSADVIDDSLLSEDIKNGGLRNGDLEANTISTTRIASQTLLSEDIKDGALTGDDIDESTLAGVDANELGGVPSHRYVQACNSNTFGAIRGFAPVAGLTSASYVSLSHSFHCESGASGQVLGRRMSVGVYRLCFNFLPVTAAVGAIVTPVSSASGVSLDNILSVNPTTEDGCNGRVFEVRSVDEGSDPDVTFQDARFYLAVISNTNEL